MKSRTAPSRLFTILMLFFLLFQSHSQVQRTAAPEITDTPGSASQAKTLTTYPKFPLSFVENPGLPDSPVKYLARGTGYDLFLTQTGATLTLNKPDWRVLKARAGAMAAVLDLIDAFVEQTTLKIQLLGSNPQAQMTGLDTSPGKMNVYVGNLPEKWLTNVASYTRVKVREIYPGIDMVYYGSQQQLEYDFIVAPGADPKKIVLELAGISGVSLNTRGDLVIPTATGQIQMRKPEIYQEVNGGRAIIPGGYTLNGRNQIAFELGAYDAAKPLIIDPVLAYSTFFGGQDGDIGVGITLGPDGAVYMLGLTSSSDLLYPEIDNTNLHVYVAKLDPDGSHFDYTTVLGGDGEENLATLISGGICSDGAGNLYISGSTTSRNFPTTAAFQTARQGPSDAFVVKLSPAGTIVYARYLGGEGEDDAGRIAVDTTGHVYVTGHTSSGDFPISTNAYQKTFGGNQSGPGYFRFFGDAFLTKLDRDGAVEYSTFLGGSADDTGIGIALDPSQLDASQNIYLTGLTSSPDFPTLNAFQETFGIPSDPNNNTNSGFNSDAFVTKFSADFTLIYSTYLGGPGDDLGVGIVADRAGSAYVTGNASQNFPVTPGAFQRIFGGARNMFGDAFATKFNDAGVLVYSTYLGGSKEEIGTGIVVDGDGSAYLTGATFSADFPTRDSLQQFPANNPDVDPISAFITRLDPAGHDLSYSTYLGTDIAGGGAIAIDSARNIYITGFASENFPIVPQRQVLFGGSLDAFIARITSVDQTPTGNSVTVDPIDDRNGAPPVSLTFETVTGPGSTTLTSSDSGPAIPGGFRLGDSPTYYDIRTTADYTGPIQVCIAYNPAQFNNIANLRLLHYDDNGWADVTTSVDPTQHLLCGTVFSLSPFVAAELDAPPTQPTITLQSRTPANAAGWNHTDVTVTWSCENSLTRSVSVTVSQEGANLSATGTCVDQAGNQASHTLGDIRIDKTPPALDSALPANPILLHGSALVQAHATDGLSGVAISGCTPVDTVSVGWRTLTCTATDQAGNTTTKSLPYHVIYRFDGFLQPINDTAHAQTCGSPCPASIFKSGSTVPVKFVLKDASGQVVQAGAAPVWPLPQMGEPTQVQIDEDFFTSPASTSTTFAWNGSEYQFHWKTKGFTPNYFWRIGVTLDDGQTYFVYVGLR